MKKINAILFKFFLLIIVQIWVGINKLNACQANFSIAVVDHEVYIINSSIGATMNTTFTWDFGDLYVSANPNPLHTYLKPGTYTVCLTMDDPNGCHSTFCKLVTIRSYCIAAFGYVRDTTSNTFYFSNITKLIKPTTTYFWDFGDGNTSTEENPTHTYSKSGQYTVCLTVTDTTNVCASSYCKTFNFIRKIRKVNSIQGETPDEPEYNTAELIQSESNISIVPNPIISSSQIYFNLAEVTRVIIGIYDFSGNCLQVVLNETKSPGQHSQLIQSDYLNPGFYFVRISLGDKHLTRRISLLK